MGSIYVRNSGAWSPVDNLRVNDNGTWKQAQRVYVMEWVFNPGTETYTKTWRLVTDFGSPSINVPGLSIAANGTYTGSDSFSTYYRAKVTWTPIVDTGDSAYSYSVRAFFFENGVNAVNVSGSQTLGELSSPAAGDIFSEFSEVYARVNYFNTRGDGPLTQTSTIIMGIP